MKEVLPAYVHYPLLLPGTEKAKGQSDVYFVTESQIPTLYLM